MLADRLPVTVMLATYSFLLTALFAIPAGLLAGAQARVEARHNGHHHRARRPQHPTVCRCDPAALRVLGRVGLVPDVGFGEGFFDRLYHLTLPAIALAIGQFAVVARQVRASTMDIVDRDYVTFAKARGTRSQHRLVAVRVTQRRTSRHDHLRVWSSPTRSPGQC